MKTPTPPPGKPKRIVKRVEPFSEWQLLVQERCQELNISTRALASKIATPQRTLEHTTIWSWLRAPEGSPPAAHYTPDLNRRLAHALDLEPDRLAEAFENARRRFIIHNNTPSQQGPLTVLSMIFKSSGRETWKTEELVKLIDDIRGV